MFGAGFISKAGLCNWICHQGHVMTGKVV